MEGSGPELISPTGDAFSLYDKKKPYKKNLDFFVPWPKYKTETCRIQSRRFRAWFSLFGSRGQNNNNNNTTTNNNNNNSVKFIYVSIQQPWANYRHNTDCTFCVHEQHLGKTHRIHYYDDDTITAVCATKRVKFPRKWILQIVQKAMQYKI